jgi:hypothetical protein
MSFLAPVLLAGLVAIAIPILLHLVQRERTRIVPFPSLMFLRKIPYESVRRRAIRDWPLLVLRALALALVAIAFARPFLPGSAGRASAAGGGREVVVLLDRSYSMGYADHWNRARDQARRTVNGLGPGDRATVVFFSTDVEIGPRSASDRAPLVTAIDGARPGAGATRYGPALRAASSILASSDLPHREIVLISDFQKSGWDHARDINLPAGAKLTPISVADPDPANSAIAALTTDRDSANGRERVTVSARLVNRGSAKVSEREVTLDVDGIHLDTRRASIEPRGSADVTFAPFTLGSGRARVTVRTTPDALPQDDTFRTVVVAGGRLPVLVVDAVHAGPDASLYLERALGVGETPGFTVKIVRADRVTPADVAEAAVVILNDTPPPISAAGRTLDERVHAGTGLFVALGPQATWPAGSPDLLPGLLGESTDRSATHGATLGFIDYSHPVFEIFRTPRSGDLTAARVFQYRQLKASGQVLARFDDGAVAVAERKVGRGLVLAWASTLDSYWTDLALKPVFVPFLHQAVKHLARYTQPRPWYTVGDILDPAAVAPPGAVAAELAAGAFVMVTPAGRRETATMAGPTGGIPLVEPGFYEIRSSAERGREPVVVAVNVDPAESDLSPLDPVELAGEVSGHAPAAPTPAAGRDLTIEEQEQRQAIWWYLLAGGMLLLIGELLVSNRRPRIT